MRKIKKFKIPIYSYEILRKSRKAGADLGSVGLDNDRDFKEYVSQLASAIEPAVVFGYFPTDDPDTAVLSYREKKPLTIAMLTLGNAIYEKTCEETDESRKTVNITTVSVFAASAAKVISDIASQEAIPEGFELSEPFYIYSCPEQTRLSINAGKKDNSSMPLFSIEQEEERNDLNDQEMTLYRDDLTRALFRRLEAGKIGMSLDGNSIMPKYSSIFAFEWIVRKNSQNR